MTSAFAAPRVATVCAGAANLAVTWPRPEVGARVAADDAGEKPIGIEAAANLTGISRWTIARAAKDGEIAHQRIGRRGHLRFRPEDLRAWRASKDRPATVEGRLSVLEERVDRLERGREADAPD